MGKKWEKFSIILVFNGLNRLDTGFLLMMPRFTPKVVVVDTVALWNVFLEVHQFFVPLIPYTSITAPEVCDRPDQPARYHDFCRGASPLTRNLTEFKSK